MPIQVWGHRGCRGKNNPPENSLAAFQAAIDQGANGIELDLYLTKDNHLVVFHDPTLERMTEGKGNIEDYTLSELKQLHLRSNDGKGPLTQERIPTYEEVLDLIERYHKAPKNSKAEENRSRTFVLNTEIVGKGITPYVADAVKNRLKQEHGWKPENFEISSFDMNSLREMKKLVPEVPIGDLFGSYGPPWNISKELLQQRLDENRDITPDTVNITIKSLTPPIVQLIKQAGAKPVAWTWEEKNPLELPLAERLRMVNTLKNNNVNVIITDYPHEMRQTLEAEHKMLHRIGSHVLLALRGFGSSIKKAVAYCMLYTHRKAIMYHNKDPEFEPVKSPNQYAELQGIPIREQTVITKDGVPINLWVKDAEPGKPTYVLFHGRSGHWGDLGPKVGEGILEYDRRCRLKFIKSLSDTGAGVIAVSMRGFGKSGGKPGEAGFELDTDAVVDYIRQRRIPADKLIIAGESLGNAFALMTAAKLTYKGYPPAICGLVNPFYSMASASEKFVNEHPLCKTLDIYLSAPWLDKYVLKDAHFYNYEQIAKLKPPTKVVFMTSGKDQIVNPLSSVMLKRIAENHHLDTEQKTFDLALHQYVPVQQVTDELDHQFRDMHKAQPVSLENENTTRLKPENFKRDLQTQPVSISM